MGSSFGIVLGFDASSDTSEEGRKEYLDLGGKVKSGGDLKAIVEGCIFASVEDMTDVDLNAHQKDTTGVLENCPKEKEVFQADVTRRDY
jgi:hypothetical protein